MIDINVTISFIELVLYHICILSVCLNIFNAQLHKSRIIISFLCFVPLLIIFQLNDAFTSFVSISIYMVVEIIIMKWTLKNIKTMSIIRIYIFLFFFNTMICTYADFIFKIEDSVNVFFELLCNFVTISIIILISFTKAGLKIKQIVFWIPFSIKNILLILLITCSLLSVVIIKEPIFEQYTKTNHFIKYLFIILIVLFSLIVPILIIYSITNKYMKYSSKNYKNQIASQSRFYTQLSQSNFELRKFKHNYKNMEIGLRKLISEGKTKEALELLDVQNHEIDSTSIPFDTGSGIVDALLADKQKQADTINTKILFEGAVPGEMIKAVDLCILFGNPLDNAIEACAKLNSGTLKEIHIDCVCNSGFVFIEIKNPVQKKVEIRGNLPETTKPDKELHGFGLYSLEQVIKKYDGEVTCECDDKTFILSMDFSIPIQVS